MCVVAAEGQEVEARHVAAEVEGGLVVGERRILGDVEGAEPQPCAVLGEASRVRAPCGEEHRRISPKGDEANERS